MMNLSELSFCDAAGLASCPRCGHARRSGRSLKSDRGRPALLRIMHITGMDEAFPEVRNPKCPDLAASPGHDDDRQLAGQPCAARSPPARCTRLLPASQSSAFLLASARW